MDSDDVQRASRLINEVRGHLDEMRTLLQAHDFDGERYRVVSRQWHSAESELNLLLPPVIDPD